MRILFVCSGNTCRSPLAEAIFRGLADKANFKAEVRSAGTSAMAGAPVASNSAAIIEQKGLQPGTGSTPVSDELVDWADLILTMEQHHKSTLLHRHITAADKTFTLKEYANTNGNDAEVIAELDALIAELQLKLASSQEITHEEQMRLLELELLTPNENIADPVGGPMELYQETADEIELHLKLLLEKLMDTKES